jgi:hypothetical protein
MKMKAWQQGYLDGLCAIYAILNATRCLFPNRATEDVLTAMWRAIIEGLGPEIGPILLDGTSRDQVSDLIRRANAFVRSEALGEIHAYQPFRTRKVSDLQHYWDDMAAYLAPRRRVAIIGLGRPWEHWTVITSVSAGAVNFHDSYGIRVFPRSRFVIGKPKGAEIALDYHQTFLIDREPIPRLRPRAGAQSPA